MEILKEIPRAVLWLIDDNPTTTANIKKHAFAAKADLKRILFTTRSAHSEYKAKLKMADVFLDNYPYNCGSTNNDVINANLPIITRSGLSLVSRMGGSLMNKLNIPDLINKSTQEYIKCCINLNNNDELMFEIKKKMNFQIFVNRKKDTAITKAIEYYSIQD